MNVTLTTIGLARVASAVASGIPLRLIFLAVGSADGSMLGASSTSLGSELVRVPIDTNTIAGNQITVSGVIQSNIGPFTLSECGVFDDQGNLIAYGALPQIYKPTAANGVAVRINVTIALSASNQAASIVVPTTNTQFTVTGSSVFFTDQTTGMIYQLNVLGGQPKFTQVQAASPSSVNGSSIVFTDSSTGRNYTLQINNGAPVFHQI